MWFAQLCVLSLCETPHIRHPSLDLPSLSHGARATASAMHLSSLSLALTLDSHPLYPGTRGLGPHLSFWFTVFLL